MEHELRLDALRGLAAFSVAAGHCATAWGVGPIYSMKYDEMSGASFSTLIMRIIHIIFNADAAVIIFFVLSGYVLTVSLRKTSSVYTAEFLKFGVKRIYRIMPTTIVSFFPLVLFVSTTGAQIINNMLLIERDINGVTWSLQVELVGSVLIFIVYFLRKEFKVLLIPLFIGLIILFIRHSHPIFFNNLPAFFLGCFVAEFRRYNKLLIKLTPLAILGLLCGNFFFGYKTLLSMFVQIVSSTIIVSVTPYSAWFSFLDKKIFSFLGKISFSFYLYHLTGAFLALKLCLVLGIPLGKLSQVANSLIYMITSIPIAILISIISYYFIEKPSIIAGSIMGEKIIGLFKSRIEAVVPTKL